MATLYQRSNSSSQQSKLSPVIAFNLSYEFPYLNPTFSSPNELYQQICKIRAAVQIIQQQYPKFKKTPCIYNPCRHGFECKYAHQQLVLIAANSLSFHTKACKFNPCRKWSCKFAHPGEVWIDYQLQKAFIYPQIARSLSPSSQPLSSYRPTNSTKSESSPFEPSASPEVRKLTKQIQKSSPHPAQPTVPVISFTSPRDCSQSLSKDK